MDSTPPPPALPNHNLRGLAVVGGIVLACAFAVVLMLNVGRSRTHLTTYLLAVFQYWWAIIFAAPACLDLLVLMRPSVDVQKWKARQRIWIPLAIIGVFVAQFLAWLDLERRSGITVTNHYSAVGDATFPYPAAWEDRQRCGEKSSVVMFNLTITNGSEPTILQNWKLHATTGDTGLDGRLVLGAIPDQIKMESGETGGFTQDWISSRLKEEPIPKGARRDGWVPFCFRGVRSEQFKGSDAEFLLSVDDVYRKTYSVEVHWRDGVFLPPPSAP